MSIDKEQKVMRLVEELVDDLFKASDEELLRDAADDRTIIKGQLCGLAKEIEVAINSLGKDRLAEARAAVASSRSDRSTTKVDPIDAREQLAEFLSSKMGMTGITLAARNGKLSSESDIISAFQDLCELRECQRNMRKPNFGAAPKAEYILKDLGITKPEEIDVEAIAWHLGATVKYDHLKDCEARIVGTDDNAIITVDKRASVQRQRFSICHELGHWIYHRRRLLYCQANEIERPSADGMTAERAADRFASELLMPEYLFVPIVESLGRPSMVVVRKVSEMFNTSQTATAIRLVEISELPLLLVSHGRSGRRWFARSQSVGNDWMPNSELSHDSSAFVMIFGKAPQTMPPKTVPASNWFARWDASRFELIEESLRVAYGEVLTLLAFKEPYTFLRYSRS
jgi:Zn-dependent peptidase ImmA (M78 family)